MPTFYAKMKPSHLLFAIFLSIFWIQIADSELGDGSNELTAGGRNENRRNGGNSTANMTPVIISVCIVISVVIIVVIITVVLCCLCKRKLKQAVMQPTETMGDTQQTQAPPGSVFYQPHQFTHKGALKIQKQVPATAGKKSYPDEKDENPTHARFRFTDDKNEVVDIGSEVELAQFEEKYNTLVYILTVSVIVE
uniref:Uncharacterized protein n=1 Tax=Panagrolaimus sp. JU765 TaxID=591449 RepID=A0AC34QX84_9BILA